MTESVTIGVVLAMLAHDDSMGGALGPKNDEVAPSPPMLQLSLLSLGQGKRMPREGEKKGRASCMIRGTKKV
jgi:hypothetical protein